jgi:hypothetical protein
MNILSRIRGEHVAAVCRSLPESETAKDTFLEKEFEVPGHGKVLFLCKRVRYKHGKSSHWSWKVVAAVLAADVIREDERMR